MTSYKDTPLAEWDREARLAGRLAMIEHVLAALIATSSEGERIRNAINLKLDLMFGRNPPGQLTKVTQEIACGAEESADYFLKACDLASAGE